MHTDVEDHWDAQKRICDRTYDNFGSSANLALLKVGFLGNSSSDSDGRSFFRFVAFFIVELGFLIVDSSASDFDIAGVLDGGRDLALGTLITLAFLVGFSALSSSSALRLELPAGFMEISTAIDPSVLDFLVFKGSPSASSGFKGFRV